MKRIYLVLVGAVVVATSTVFLLGVASAKDKPNTHERTTENGSPEGTIAQEDSTSQVSSEDPPAAEISGAKKRTRIQRFSNTQPILIPAGQPTTTSGPATPYPSSIFVSFSRLRQPSIRDVNLTLRSFSHNDPDDVDVLLVGPQGQNAIVMSDVCGSTPITTPITIGLNDEAAGPLPDNGPCVSATYQPTNANPAGDSDAFPAPAPTPSGNTALSIFDFTNPTGFWSLYVVDDTTGDVGEFTGGWSLEIWAKGTLKKRGGRR